VGYALAGLLMTNLMYIIIVIMSVPDVGQKA
jgi:hypothetical protein